MQTFYNNIDFSYRSSVGNSYYLEIQDGGQRLRCYERICYKCIRNRNEIFNSRKLHFYLKKVSQQSEVDFSIDFNNGITPCRQWFSHVVYDIVRGSLASHFRAQNSDVYVWIPWWFFHVLVTAYTMQDPRRNKRPPPSSRLPYILQTRHISIDRLELTK